ADDVSIFSCCLENFQCFVNFFFGNDCDHADTHVKGVEHITFWNFADSLDFLKDWQYTNFAAVDHCFCSAVECSRNVFIESAAGYMDDGFYLNFIDELEHWFYIQLGWGKQGFAQSGTIKLFEDVSWCVLQIKYLSYQRET